MRLTPRTVLLAGGLLALSSCATLNTQDMSPACRDQYNACLDSCQPAARPRPLTGGPADNQTVHMPGDTETPGCVDTCNHQAKQCT